MAAAMRAPTCDILYAEDFDDPAAPNAPVPPESAGAKLEVIEPSFTREELEAVRIAALEEGAAAERARLAAEDVTARARAMHAIGEALVEAGQAARIAAGDAAEALAQAVLSVIAAALPALCARHGEGEVRAFVRGLLPALTAEPAITVRLNPHLLDAVRADLAGLDPEIAAAVQLVPTDAMLPGDVRVSWDGGSCQRSTAAACAAIRDILAPLGLLLPEPPLAENRPDLTRILEIDDVR